ncbi:hypothetical protein ACFCYB_33395 [Streptomyces sp. NPDC056309]|uniref:hypothetical protein n=1 Tax=unclassified Streptomyces TaxID=2593676 RepID=UPI0035D8321A
MPGRAGNGMDIDEDRAPAEEVAPEPAGQPDRGGRGDPGRLTPAAPVGPPPPTVSYGAEALVADLGALGRIILDVDRMPSAERLEMRQRTHFLAFEGSGSRARRPR